MEEHKLDLQPALDFAGDLCHRSIARFEVDRRSLPSWGPEIDRDVKIYVQGMQDWIVGSLHWSFTTKRYFGIHGEEVKKHRTIQLLSSRKQELLKSVNVDATTNPYSVCDVKQCNSPHSSHSFRNYYNQFAAFIHTIILIFMRLIFGNAKGL